MRIKKFEAGFLLLEVLVAISVLSIGATASVRVIGESTFLSRRLTEIDFSRKAKEDILFRIIAGQFPELFVPEGGAVSGTVEVEENKLLLFQLESAALAESKQDYEIFLNLTTLEGKEISESKYLLRPEVLS